MTDRQDLELLGKTCVVTGAGRGIGAGIADSFGREGARVIVVDRDADSSKLTVDRLRSDGVDAHVYVADVRDERSVESVAEQVARDVGGVDVLVNNAGISEIRWSFELSLDEWNRSIEVMQTGVFLCSRAFGRVMRDSGGGTIVNLSSINGLTAFPGRLAYSAAKAAVVSMTRVLAVEWASYGIRVNAVAPGLTRTRMVDDAVEQGHIDREAYLARIPLRRFADVSEMAEVVLFLAGQRSSYVTGQVIAVDGGWTTFGWTPWDGVPHSGSDRRSLA